MLYIVPTPIGNKEDITLRALRILSEVDIILAEDTRTSGNLMKLLDIKTPLRSYHSFNEHKAVESIIDLLKSGTNIALISDAGTPGISDPGFLLTRACQQNNIPLTVLPGPTALIPALVASGLPCDKFHFEGFLPHKKGRHTRWTVLSQLDTTIVMYESPYRLIKCLEEVVEYCGTDRQVCVVREISKMFEEVLTLPVLEMLENYKARPSVKGEIVVVVEGKKS